MSTTSLMSSEAPLQNQGGSSWFNQNPRQLSAIVLKQLGIVAVTWTQVLLLPRAEYITIQDFWIYNRGASPMDCYFAFVAAGSAFDNTLGVDQDDVFQICDSVDLHFRESNYAQVALNPKQALWFYSTQNCNMRISGIQVNA